VNMPVEDALKAFEHGLYSAGFYNFGKDLHKILSEKFGLDLEKDSKEKLLKYHWNNLLVFKGKPITYFISLTLNKNPFMPLDFDSLIRFEVVFPAERIAERIKDIDEKTLIVKASKEDGAYYSEDEFTFLNYVLPPHFIEGFSLLEKISSKKYKEVFFRKNQNFNPFK